MRLLSLIVAFVASGTLAIYVLTCSVNNAPPAPVHPIVGRWEQVVQNGRPVVPGRGMCVEYKPDGVVVFSAIGRQGDLTHEYGHYVVSGNGMDVTVPSRIQHQQFLFEFTFVTPDRLAAADLSLGGVEEYIRVQ